MATITTKETRSFTWSDFDRSALKVGDEIAETLKDGREVVFVVMDDGVIGLKDCLGYHCMNRDWTNQGGWPVCDMRRYLNEKVFALLPDELQAAIKPRTFGNVQDKLWLFSEPEIFGGHVYGKGDEEDKQLRYFAEPGSRVKLDADGDLTWWWERSPNARNSSNFCLVDSNGNAYYLSANANGGVCFGFFI